MGAFLAAIPCSTKRGPPNPCLWGPYSDFPQCYSFARLFFSLAVSSTKIHFFASFPGQLTGKVNRIKYSKVLVNVGRAFNRRTGVFKAPVKGIYQFFFSTLTGRGGKKTDLWLVVNNYWVAVSHTHIPRSSTVSTMSTYMTFLRRGAIVYVTQYCGASWANAASTTITFGGSLLVQMR